MNKNTSMELAQNSTAGGALSPEGQSLPQGDNAPPASISTEPVSTQVKVSPPRRKFSVEYKVNILAAYEACDNALARGELLRKEGLYHSRITAWRQQRDAGRFGKSQKNKTTNKVRQLERENQSLKKKLAQAEAVLELQKKVSELLGQHILEPGSNEEIS